MSRYKAPYTDSPLWDESKGYAMIDFADIITQYTSRNCMFAAQLAAT